MIALLSKTLSAKTAAAVDKELMSTGGFSIDQLMELAGLAVAQVVYKVHPVDSGKRILILVGPGNNGGDGLVAARHLSLLGYDPLIYYPKKSKGELFERLETQLKMLHIPFINDLDSGLSKADHIIDSLFGFSFKPPLRDPFSAVIRKLSETNIPVTSVDIPSSWDVDNGPGIDNKFNPTYLISLTAPKPAANYFKGRQFVGGRFISHEFAARYGFEVPNYPNLDQCVEVNLNVTT